MTKRLLIFMGMLFSILALNAQQQLPNGSFEDSLKTNITKGWTPVSGTVTTTAGLNFGQYHWGPVDGSNFLWIRTDSISLEPGGVGMKVPYTDFPKYLMFDLDYFNL